MYRDKAYVLQFHLEGDWHRIPKAPSPTPSLLMLLTALPRWLANDASGSATNSPACTILLLLNSHRLLYQTPGLVTNKQVEKSQQTTKLTTWVIVPPQGWWLAPCVKLFVFITLSLIGQEQHHAVMWVHMQ